MKTDSLMLEEIHILFLKVEAGPFSPKEVVKYMKEGLLLPCDPARCHHEKQWTPLIDVLIENLAPTADVLSKELDQYGPITFSPAKGISLKKENVHVVELQLQLVPKSLAPPFSGAEEATTPKSISLAEYLSLQQDNSPPVQKPYRIRRRRRHLSSPDNEVPKHERKSFSRNLVWHWKWWGKHVFIGIVFILIVWIWITVNNRTLGSQNPLSPLSGN